MIQIIAGGEHNTNSIIHYDRVLKVLYFHGKVMTAITKDARR